MDNFNHHEPNQNTMNTTREKSETNPAYAGFYKVIAPLIMCSGVGDGITTACVMAQAATIDALRKGKTLDKPTDEMECACPVLRRMAIRANDANWWKSNEERTELLRPLIPLLLDSRASKEVTDKRIFFVADKCVRDLTPMRLEFIAKHSKSEKVKAANAEGAAKLRALTPIVDRATALEASKFCETLRASAYADADAYASAYADADASAYADASASAYASASADASADAIKAQRVVYRTAFLKLFREVAAIKE